MPTSITLRDILIHSREFNNFLPRNLDGIRDAYKLIKLEPKLRDAIRKLDEQHNIAINACLDAETDDAAVDALATMIAIDHVLGRLLRSKANLYKRKPKPTQQEAHT